jgi:uncharacterized protein YqgV (UPF0045/DUF77 family)
MTVLLNVEVVPKEDSENVSLIQIVQMIIQIAMVPLCQKHRHVMKIVVNVSKIIQCHFNFTYRIKIIE